MPVRKVLPMQYSTGLQSPSNDQSLSIHNGGGVGTTFFTEVNSNMLSPKHSLKLRPGTAGASRTMRAKQARTTMTVGDGLFDELNMSQMSTTNKTSAAMSNNNMTRPMSISLRMQEERDLKWMKVQETSLTRSEERD
jgi:hypothetical protein